jgi:NitT/TauT family transport system ATP-binding protein
MRLLHLAAAPDPAPLRDAHVSVTSVSKLYGRGERAVAALKDISLEVASGEFVCLVGASGSGKSTLLNLLAGLEQPTAGNVFTGGGRVALMFQEPALMPWLSALGNVLLPIRIRGRLSEAAAHDEARRLLAMVGLREFTRRRPHELSGGMRQRVALARALAQEADVLLMDEPFGALDAITRDLLHDELEQIWLDRRMTVVFVTHNAREAVRLGDRVVVLTSRPGRVAADIPIRIPRPRQPDSAEVASAAREIGERLRMEVRLHGN